MLDSDCFSTFFNSNFSSNNKIKRRFTNQQIKSLETIFEFESKLEARKKLQVAKDLGLQPKQVAIWFQNKRARWKSKQLEKDYNQLRAGYDSLSSKYDILIKENQSLIQQLKKLHELVMEKKEKSCSPGLSSNEEKVSDGDSDSIMMKPESRDEEEEDDDDQLLDDEDTSNQWFNFWS